jgi:preprotein translocase subunit SecA
VEADLVPFKGKAEEASKFIMNLVEEAYQLKCSMESPERLTDLERYVMLRSVDTEWQTYLRSMDDLRGDVRLRSYAQRDPLVEYKREASIMFYDLMERIKLNVCTAAFHSSTSLAAMQGFMTQLANSRRVKTNNPENQSSILAQATAAVAGANEHAARAEQSKRLAANTSSANNSDAFDRAMAVAEKAQAAREAASNGAPRKAAPSVGRNEPCPCGSGKKYKKCCGANS